MTIGAIQRADLQERLFSESDRPRIREYLSGLFPIAIASVIEDYVIKNNLFDDIFKFFLAIPDFPKMCSYTTVGAEGIMSAYPHRDEFPQPVESFQNNDLFFEQHRPVVLSRLLDITQAQFPKDVAKIIADYVIGKRGIFGPKEWEDTFGVAIEGSIPSLPLDIYTFLDREDPFDKTKKIKDTFFPPILCPKGVRSIKTQTSYSYNLITLKYLAQNPLNGQHPAELVDQSRKFFAQDESRPPKEACWILMRMRMSPYKPVESFHTEVEWDSIANKTTGFGFERFPSITHVATVALVVHALSGKRCFSDDTEPDGYSFSVCQESIALNGLPGRMKIGNFLRGISISDHSQLFLCESTQLSYVSESRIAVIKKY